MIDVEVRGRWAAVRLSGEWDLSNADEIVAAVRHLRSLDVSDLVIDLSLVTFLDGYTLGRLLTATELMREGRVALIGASPHTARVVRLAGLADELPLALLEPPTVAADTAGDEALADGLASLSRLLVDDAALTDALQRLLVVAVDSVPGCIAASAAILARGTPRTVAASGPIAVEVDIAQYSHMEGPCIEAARTGRRLRVDFLDSGSAYPHLAPLGVAAGVHATLSLPVTSGQETIGSLNLYSDTPGGFDQTSETIGEVLATQVALILVGSATSLTARDLASTAQRRSDDRVDIGVAEGVLAGMHRCSLDQAARLLRSASDANREALVETARRLVHHVALLPPET